MKYSYLLFPALISLILASPAFAMEARECARIGQNLEIHLEFLNACEGNCEDADQARRHVEKNYNLYAIDCGNDSSSNRIIELYNKISTATISREFDRILNEILAETGS